MTTTTTTTTIATAAMAEGAAIARQGETTQMIYGGTMAARRASGGGTCGDASQRRRQHAAAAPSAAAASIGSPLLPPPLARALTYVAVIAIRGGTRASRFLRLLLRPLGADERRVGQASEWPSCRATCLTTTRRRVACKDAAGGRLRAKTTASNSERLLPSFKVSKLTYFDSSRISFNCAVFRSTK